MLDLIGLNCPMPVIRTKRAMAQLEPGATLQVMTTDPRAIPDIAQFCAMAKYDILHQETSNEVTTTTIRKPSS